jgi:hypothetical protein
VEVFVVEREENGIEEGVAALFDVLLTALALVLVHPLLKQGLDQRLQAMVPQNAYNVRKMFKAKRNSI